MNKYFKKVCTGVVVASTVTTLVTPSISLAAGTNTYKDGVYQGDGGGYYYIKSHAGDQRKIKVNVEFENNEIKNVEIVGVSISSDKMKAKKVEAEGYSYPDDLQYLRAVNGGEGDSGAIRVIELIKSRGLENIDKLIEDLENMFHTGEINHDLDVISTCTASSIGIAKAVKEAALLSKKANEAENVKSIVNSITLESLPSDLKKDETITTKTLMRVLEGDKTNFDGLKVRVSYVDGKSEVVEFKDFEKKGLKLVNVKNSGNHEISHGTTFTFNKANEFNTFNVVDKETGKEGIFEVVTKSVEYIPSKLEFKVGDGEYRDVNLNLEPDNSLFFSDLNTPTFYQDIELKSSDLGKKINVRTTLAKHERTKDEIDTYVISDLVEIPIDAKAGTSLRFTGTKNGNVRPINWKLNVKNIVDDKNEQVEKLNNLLKKVEEDKTISEELKKDKVSEKYSAVKNSLDSSKELLKDIENKSSSEINDAITKLQNSLDSLDKGIEKHNKDNIVNEMKKHLEEAKKKIESTNDAHKKSQYKDIVDLVNKKIDENEKYLLTKDKVKDLEDLIGELDKTFRSPAYVELFELVDTEAWRLITQNDDMDKAKNIHNIRVALREKLKKFNDKYYSEEDNIYGKHKDLIFDDTQHGLIGETRALMEVMELNDKLGSIKRKTLSAKPISVEELELYSEALNFVIKKDVSTSGNSVGVSSTISENKLDKEEVKNIDRLSGIDRYDTAIKISDKKFNKASKVYLVSGKNFADAISASGLTKKLDGPLLLVDDSSADRVVNEINRLGAKDAVLIGGESSISKEVEVKLARNVEKIERLAGKDRYSTSVLTSAKVLKEFGNKGKVIIASGFNFADAISISSYASKEGLPMILVDKNGLTKEQLNFIKENNLNEALIIGGTNSVNKSVESKFEKSERIAGNDRYETSLKIAQKLFANTNVIYLASGQIYADALAGGYLAGSENAPILLVEKNNISNMSLDLVKKAKKVEILGGQNTISDNLLNKIK